MFDRIRIHLIMVIIIAQETIYNRYLFSRGSSDDFDFLINIFVDTMTFYRTNSNVVVRLCARLDFWPCTRITICLFLFRVTETSVTRKCVYIIMPTNRFNSFGVNKIFLLSSCSSLVWVKTSMLVCLWKVTLCPILLHEVTYFNLELSLFKKKNSACADCSEPNDSLFIFTNFVLWSSR